MQAGVTGQTHVGEEGNKCELAKFPKADRLDRLPVLGGGDFAASYIRQKCGCSMLNLALPHGLSAISIVSSISAMRSDVQNAVALFFRLVMTRNSLAPWR
jgi:hypothetical protein